MKNKLLLEKYYTKDRFGVMIYNNKEIEIRVVYSPFYGEFICARDCTFETNDKINEIGVDLGICKAEPKDKTEPYRQSETLFSYYKALKHFDIETY